MKKATVYFTKDICPEGLKKVYEALGVTLKGNVAVKNFHRGAGLDTIS